jgi:hypothetical protein
MKSLKITVSSLTLVLLLIMGLGSCKKPAEFFDKINTGSGDANRKTIVKIVGGENDINLISLDITPTIEEIVLIELQRDANSEADLGSALTVKLVKNATLIADYNTTNGTSLIELPLAAYTFPEDISNISFAPGEFIKTVKLRLDKSKLDLSKQYALGIKIAEVGSGAAIGAGKGSALYGLLIKNPYEGDYTTSGFFFHPSAPRALDDSKYLYTQSATRCLAPLADLYNSGYYFAFDVSGTNTLINWNATPVAPPSSGFFTADNPGGIAYPGPEYPGTAPYVQTTYNNTYNPGSKTFYMHYGYGVGSTSQNGWSRNVYEKWVRQ